ncbi:hypothetical protein NPIL_597201 [Nephila pilipes]|uniref:Uncharacterized protein n=1 Tax=Nephila pilipes TaxID=299642 RepID=A0A8X6Q5C0_NEPPI|nr:hypothetical protein NPIL_597201 [Nephila pilipes]
MNFISLSSQVLSEHFLPDSKLQSFGTPAYLSDNRAIPDFQSSANFHIWIPSAAVNFQTEILTFNISISFFFFQTNLFNSSSTSRTLCPSCTGDLSTRTLHAPLLLSTRLVPPLLSSQMTLHLSRIFADAFASLAPYKSDASHSLSFTEALPDSANTC